METSIKKSDSTLRHTAPGRLRSLLSDHPSPVLLVGAGASITSGIPAAGQTVERAARWAWCKEHGRQFNDPAVRPSDYRPWLSQQSWFEADANLADLYPTAIDMLLGVKEDRKAFFVDLISPSVPSSKGYRSLAKILHQGWISTVLTTNFDDCIHKAARVENKPHHLIKMKTYEDLVQFSAVPSFPQLVYLHGSVEHYTDKNLVAEIQDLDKRLVDIVKTLFRDRPLIVVGYRGSEPSIMNHLFLDQLEFTKNFAKGIYWCTMDSPERVSLSPFLQKLVGSIGSNFNSISINGFDELFEDELWNRMVATNTPPVRRLPSETGVSLPPDMQPLKANTIDDLDKALLRTRLAQYADKLGLWRPDDSDDSWVLDTAISLNLVANDDPPKHPTLAGILLFGKDPTFSLPSAKVKVVLEGPENWIRRCFGEEMDLDQPDVESSDYRVEKYVNGNLWSQIDELTDLLSIVNFSFRLKGAISQQVQAYNPLALKEMLVNALVHRDYSHDQQIEIHVSPMAIEAKSPGGLIDEVSAQTGGIPLEAAIKKNRRGIKGYRNPVISDLFYGGGQMDREGSGLSDMWKETINNNGDVNFGPDLDNQFFNVKLHSRPEVVDQVTNTAITRNRETHRFAANMITIHELPDTVYCAKTTAGAVQTLKGRKHGENVPPGYVQNYVFYSFFDLSALVNNVRSPFQKSDIECFAVNELYDIPNGRNILVKLFNEAIYEHCKALGMWVDYKRKRVYFPKLEDEEERKITYKGRVRQATRTVVKARKKRESNDILYFEHKALSFNVMDFGDQWAIVLSPGYAFTRNGFGRTIGRERTNVLSTRRAAKDFNQQVHQDVVFWIAMLSEESNGIFALQSVDSNAYAEFLPTILLSDRPPTVSYGAKSFAPDDEIMYDIQQELDDLDDEIIAMAEEEDEFDEEDFDDD